MDSRKTCFMRNIITLNKGLMLTASNTAPHKIVQKETIFSQLLGVDFKTVIYTDQI